MPEQKEKEKKNVDSEFPVFKAQCSMDNSVTTVGGKALCLLSNDMVLEEHYTYNGIIR